jgi:CheY-like chemotaxis protein
MPKVMLVEDDNNLREIYEARLLAEGYEIVSARDGEEALALAVKEKPDLIIADVMMPKISGFDMLDILRSTPETKNTKVIMMTALSQAEDKARAAQLGADRYLVKSQVTLEDVAKVAREVLEGGDSPSTPPPPATPPSDPTPPATPPADPTPTTPPPEQTATPTSPPPATPPADNSTAQMAAAIPATNIGQTTAQASAEVEAQINSFAAAGVVADPTTSPAAASITPVATTVEQPSGTPTPPPSSVATPAQTAPTASGSHSKVIAPINDLTKPQTDLNELLKKEQVKEQLASVAQEILHKQTQPVPGLPATMTPAPGPQAAMTIDPNSIAL